MTKETRTILVTGATGRQGGAVARHLLADGWRVRAFTRDPAAPKAQALAEAGAEVVKGDLYDRASVDRAVKGVYGVFSVQDFWEHGGEGEIRQGKTLADAAAAAGIEHLVYSSVGGADRNTGIPHFDSKWEIENHIRGLGLPATILRPVWFMENMTAPAMRSAILEGALALGLPPEKRLAMIAVDDIGVFAALAFENPGEWIGKALEIAGDEPTMTRAAETLSWVLGRPVAFVEIPIDELRSRSEEYAVMFEWFRDHGYQPDLPALRALHPGLLTLEAWLRKTGWADAARSVVGAAAAS